MTCRVYFSPPTVSSVHASSSWLGDVSHAPTCDTKNNTQITSLVNYHADNDRCPRMSVPGQQACPNQVQQLVGWHHQTNSAGNTPPPPSNTHICTHDPYSTVQHGTVWYRHGTPQCSTVQYRCLGQCVIQYTNHVEAVFALLLALVFVQQNLFRLRFIRSICLSGGAKARGNTAPAVQCVLLTLLCACVEVVTLVPAVEGCVSGWKCIVLCQ